MWSIVLIESHLVFVGPGKFEELSTHFWWQARHASRTRHFGIHLLPEKCLRTLMQLTHMLSPFLQDIWDVQIHMQLMEHNFPSSDLNG